MQFCNSLLLCGRLDDWVRGVGCVHLSNNNGPGLLAMLIRMIGTIANTTAAKWTGVAWRTKTKGSNKQRASTLQFQFQRSPNLIGFWLSVVRVLTKCHRYLSYIDRSNREVLASIILFVIRCRELPFFFSSSFPSHSPHRIAPHSSQLHLHVWIPQYAQNIHNICL